MGSGAAHTEILDISTDSDSDCGLRNKCLFLLFLYYNKITNLPLKFYAVFLTITQKLRNVRNQNTFWDF